MSMRINAGYAIVSSVFIGESEFVLGIHLKSPGQFVTWKCSGGNNYYWGHYFSDQFAAEKDLIARAQEEIQCLEELNGQSEKQKPLKGKEHER
ncbi:MAG: hypothetical protein J1E06_09285 [Acutalibacter sp.]|nr:hypothetical protein [Acutalibacter sp.]